MKGIDAIRKYWNAVADTQKDVKFEYEILESNNSHGIAHWKSSFVRAKQNTLVLLDGILVAHLDSENKCIRFQEWWQSKKPKIFESIKALLCSPGYTKELYASLK